VWVHTGTLWSRYTLLASWVDVDRGKVGGVRQQSVMIHRVVGGSDQIRSDLIWRVLCVVCGVYGRGG
jgi:hypothetical protein